MRIAVPTYDGNLCPHFGHCEEFTIIEVDPAEKRVLSSDTVAAPEHEPGLLPVWLKEKRADLVIAGGMGGRAQELFARNGIEVLVGAPVAPPRLIVESYLQGSLELGGNVCDH